MLYFLLGDVNHTESNRAVECFDLNHKENGKWRLTNKLLLFSPFQLATRYPKAQTPYISCNTSLFEKDCRKKNIIGNQILIFDKTYARYQSLKTKVDKPGVQDKWSQEYCYDNHSHFLQLFGSFDLAFLHLFVQNLEGCRPN